MPLKSPRIETVEVAKQVVKQSQKPEPEKYPEKTIAMPVVEKVDKEENIVPVRKIKINRETGKKIVSGESIALVEETDGAENIRPEKMKTKIRRKVQAADGTASTLVDYTSTSSTGGSPVRRLEEKLDIKKTVVKTMEEYNNDSSTPAEDEIVMIQVPLSKWEKEDYESEDDDAKSALVAGSGKSATVKNVAVTSSSEIKQTDKDSPQIEKMPKAAKEPASEELQPESKVSKTTVPSEKEEISEKEISEKEEISKKEKISENEEISKKEIKEKEHPAVNKETMEKRKAGTSSTGGSPVRRLEEKLDIKKTVVKTMEEYNNDSSTPAEDEIVMIQVPLSKWEKEDYESEDDDAKSALVAGSGKSATVKNVAVTSSSEIKQTDKDSPQIEKMPKAAKEPASEELQPESKVSKTTVPSEKEEISEKEISEKEEISKKEKISENEEISKKEIKEKEHPAVNKETMEKRKAPPSQSDKERNPERSSEKSGSSYSSKDRTVEKSNAGSRASSVKDNATAIDKKTDYAGSNRDNPSSKRKEEKLKESNKRRDSPSLTKEHAPSQKSRDRGVHVDIPRKVATESKRTEHSPARDKKTHTDYKNAPDSKRAVVDNHRSDKMPSKDSNRHATSETRSNKERDHGGYKSHRTESPDVRTDMERTVGQNEREHNKNKPLLVRSTRLSSDLTRETDEAAFVPDYSESDGNGKDSKLCERKCERECGRCKKTGNTSLSFIRMQVHCHHRGDDGKAGLC
ncbi:UNVERIFIED_CONTAM: hypothetical protein FKN15_013667 [Acipenser sinensis]